MITSGDIHVFCGPQTGLICQSLPPNTLAIYEVNEKELPQGEIPTGQPLTPAASPKIFIHFPNTTSVDMFTLALQHVRNRLVARDLDARRDEATGDGECD